LKPPGARPSLQLAVRLVGHNNVITGLAWSPDGHNLASTGDDTIRIWSADTSDRSSFTVNTGGNAKLRSVNVSSDRRWLAAGDDAGRVHVWNLSSLEQQTGFQTQHSKGINLIAWSPSASILATADAAGFIELSNWPDQGHAGSIVAAADDVLALRWLPDGKHIIASGGDDGAITIRSADGGGSEILSPKNNDSVSGLAVISDGSRLLSLDVSGKLWFWDLPARRLLDSPRFDTGTTGGILSLSHDQRRVLAAGNSGDVLIYDTTSAGANTSPIHCQSSSKILDDAQFGSGDKSVYAISADATLHVWTLSDRCELVASAPSPLANRPTDDPAYRHHLIVIPEINALALTLGTSLIRVVSLDMTVWVKRARTIGYGD
jgi:WD40 repeat protein